MSRDHKLDDDCQSAVEDQPTALGVQRDVFEGFEPSEGSDSSPLGAESYRRITIDVESREAEIADNPRNTHNARGYDLGAPAPRRVEIDLTGGYDPHDAAPRLWALVADANDASRLFLTETGPVRLEIIDDQPQLMDLTIERLMQEVHRVANFIKVAKSRVRDCPCPRQLVAEMRATPFNNIPLPRLRQVATAPLVADETGRIVFENGYHSDLGIFLWCEQEIDPVPPQPSSADVAKARQILTEPLQDFPFVDDAGRATAMAIMLTPFVRRLIKGPTPLHLIEKATPGTGASLLTDVLPPPSVGTAVQKLTPPSMEGEWKYELAAVLRGLPAAVVIDNARDITSPSLAKALTDDVMITRLVGSSNTAALPVLCVWVGTGNNPTLHQEIARRAVRCRLDAGVEQPWRGRTFRIPNLKEWLAEHRSEMTWAVLTIIRSWFEAGQPRAEDLLGMFESYSAIIGGILRHVGIRGFLGESAVIDANSEDLQTEAERWLITNWWARFKGTNVPARYLVELVEQSGSPVLDLWGPEARPDTYARRLGWLVRSLLGKTIHADGTATGGPGETVKVCRSGDDPVSRTARYHLDPVRAGS